MPSMKMPKVTDDAMAALDALAPQDPEVTRRPMFGQASLFVRGNMFLGTFGGRIFVRLGDTDRQNALDKFGMELFEPMPGRPMREYVVLPPSVLAQPREAKKWVGRSLEYARGLPPKASKPGGKARTKPK